MTKRHIGTNQNLINHKFNDKFNDDKFNDKFNDDKFNDKFNDDKFNDKFNDDKFNDKFNDDKFNDKFNIFFTYLPTMIRACYKCSFICFSFIHNILCHSIPSDIFSYLCNSIVM